MICLYGETAMEFWRTAQVMEARVIDAYARAGTYPEEDELILTNYLEGRRIPLAACGAPSLKRDLIEHIAAKYLLSLPLRLAVGDKRDKRNSSIAKVHAVESLKNLDEFIFIDSSLAVASPALCVCLKTSSFDEIDLSVFISIACSAYTIDSNETYLRARKLASKQEIRECADAISKLDSKHIRGRGLKVIKALEYSVENLYSPREMVLQQLLCLPKRLGGFGLPLPEANIKFELDTKQSVLADRTFVMPDLYWESAKICIEYDGRLYHCSPEQIENDRTKRAVLQECGVTTLHVDNAMIKNISATREIALEIARRLGFKLRTRGELFGEKHLILRKKLLLT